MNIKLLPGRPYYLLLYFSYVLAECWFLWTLRNTEFYNIGATSLIDDSSHLSVLIYILGKLNIE